MLVPVVPAAPVTKVITEASAVVPAVPARRLNVVVLAPVEVDVPCATIRMCEPALRVAPASNGNVLSTVSTVLRPAVVATELAVSPVNPPPGPIETLPVPLPANARLTLASPPAAETVGATPVVLPCI